MTLVEEDYGGNKELPSLTLKSEQGKIYADLSIGANLAGTVALKANGNISSNEMMLNGSGFIVTKEEAISLSINKEQRISEVIKDYRDGKDLTATPRDVMVIDLYGHTAKDVLEKHPPVYNHILTKVKPARDTNPRKGTRENWWIYAEPRKTLRAAMVGLSRYLATPETAKHRFYVFLDSSIVPDHRLIAIAVEDAYCLGVLNSNIHVDWSNAAGGRMGVGNDSVYNKIRYLAPFPFTPAAAAQKKQPFVQ